jgi:hypothetical protein
MSDHNVDLQHPEEIIKTDASVSLLTIDVRHGVPKGVEDSRKPFAVRAGHPVSGCFRA